MAGSQFTRVGRALPTISNVNQMQQYMANWKSSVTRGLRRPVPAPPPQNFMATNARGGISLTWAPASLNAQKNASPIGSPGGPDGYEIIKSASGNFKTDTTIIPIRDPTSNTYFDATG